MGSVMIDVIGREEVASAHAQEMETWFWLAAGVRHVVPVVASAASELSDSLRWLSVVARRRKESPFPSLGRLGGSSATILRGSIVDVRAPIGRAGAGTSSRRRACIAGVTRCEVRLEEMALARPIFSSVRLRKEPSRRAIDPPEKEKEIPSRASSSSSVLGGPPSWMSEPSPSTLAATSSATAAATRKPSRAGFGEGTGGSSGVSSAGRPCANCFMSSWANRCRMPTKAPAMVAKTTPGDRGVVVATLVHRDAESRLRRHPLPSCHFPRRPDVPGTEGHLLIGDADEDIHRALSESRFTSVTQSRHISTVQCTRPPRPLPIVRPLGRHASHVHLSGTSTSQSAHTSDETPGIDCSTSSPTRDLRLERAVSLRARAQQKVTPSQE